MSEFVQQLQNAIVASGLPAKRMLLAVSGGADSIALLWGCAALREKLPLDFVVAHLNHQLRGAESDEDARFVADLCRRLDALCVIQSTDVGARAREDRSGIEETARRVRYEFLEEVARRENCQLVLTAHTADDQAETILHHIVRGTGLAGLRGIASEREFAAGIVLVRPLLFATRSEIEGYLTEIGQPWRTDATNEDETLTRVRIRRSLLPLLEREYNPNVRKALLNIGEQAFDVYHRIEQEAELLMRDAMEHSDDTSCRVNRDALAEVSIDVLRECFCIVWKRMGWPRQRMGFPEWNRLAEIARAGGTAILPGNIDARTRGKLIVLTRR
ncbi:MAG: tRNA lysidine(34) synthetase TilS [Planctomycetaceae bacterium]